MLPKQSDGDQPYFMISFLWQQRFRIQEGMYENTSLAITTQAELPLAAFKYLLSG
jgi:hypothetical protein